MVLFTDTQLCVQFHEYWLRAICIWDLSLAELPCYCYYALLCKRSEPYVFGFDFSNQHTTPAPATMNLANDRNDWQSMKSEKKKKKKKQHNLPQLNLITLKKCRYSKICVQSFVSCLPFECVFECVWCHQIYFILITIFVVHWFLLLLLL